MDLDGGGTATLMLLNPTGGVLGGDTLLDGTPAAEAGPIPARNYLGATNQTGQHTLTATTW